MTAPSSLVSLHLSALLVLLRFPRFVSEFVDVGGGVPLLLDLMEHALVTIKDADDGSDEDRDGRQGKNKNQNDEVRWLEPSRV